MYHDKPHMKNFVNLQDKQDILSVKPVNKRLPETGQTRQKKQDILQEQDILQNNQKKDKKILE